MQSIICPTVSNNPLTNRTVCHDGDEDDDHGDDDECWGRQCVLSLANKCSMFNGLWWDCSSGGSRGEPTPHFLTKMRPKGPKKFFGRPGPPLISGSGWPPPLSEGLDLPLCRLMGKTLDNEKNDFFHNSDN